VILNNIISMKIKLIAKNVHIIMELMNALTKQSTLPRVIGEPILIAQIYKIVII
jgi:hypothetical protein